MTIGILFWVLALSCCTYAALFGGWEGRWFAAIYIAQCFLTLLATFVNFHWSSTNWPTFAIDFLLWVGLAAIAFKTHRFWPLWVLGLHHITISAHLASLISTSPPFRAYFLFASVWAVPKLLAVVVGIWLDLKEGLPQSTRIATRVLSNEQRNIAMARGNHPVARHQNPNRPTRS